MSVNSLLTSLASQAIPSDEKLGIERSINAISAKLDSFFGDQIAGKIRFGSYSRDTILPRSIDDESDVDYMIVFKDQNLTPQTYLKKLKSFAEYYYQRSEVFQSTPTVVIALNHIKFELVPALKNNIFFQQGYSIPAKASSYQRWMQTDPTGFNGILTSKNVENRSLIKPLIRVMKCWNVCAGKPFESFDLEQTIVQKNFSASNPLYSLFAYGSNGQSQSQLKDYFFEFVNSLTLDWSAAQWKRDKISRLKATISQAQSYDQQGYNALAESEIRKAFSGLSW